MRKINSLGVKTIAARSSVVLCFAAIYFAGVFFVFWNGTAAIEIQNVSVSNEVVESAIGHQWVYDSAFFRIAANKLQYVKHDPAILMQAFHLAIRKAPANVENLFLLGEYEASRNNVAQARMLFSEAVRRFPTDAVFTANAGLSLLNAGDLDGLKFLADALNIDPALSYEIYPAAIARGASFDRLIEITPMKAEPFVVLCGFLASRDSTAVDAISKLIEKTDTLSLEPQQELRIARCAMKVHLYPLARKYADRLTSNAELSGKAKTLIREIDAMEKRRN